MAALARRAWQGASDRGYGRIDLRLDARGAPFVLEINPNPCLEPHAGFAAAAAQAGIEYPELINRIVQESVASGA
jgi:D-alanine-D-alanine ligase